MSVSRSFVDPGRGLYQELLSFLTGRLRCRHAAADLTQECYARALGASHDARPTDTRAWMFSVARHLVIDSLRHQRVEQAWLAERESLASSFVPSAEYRAAQRQVVAQVVAVLQAMPPRRRDVFVMFRVYGHTREEIAQSLRITEAAVAKHVVRATLDCAQTLAEARRAMPEREWISSAALRPALNEADGRP